MRAQSTTVEQKLARIAGAQHGVVTRKQLLEAGISRTGIQRLVRKGALLPEYRGVYRVGHGAPSVEASYLAAVYACGEGALLSGRAAGWILGLVRGRPPAPEVTAPTTRRVGGVRTRRCGEIEATVCRCIPVTTVARTLVDLAAEFGQAELARACHEAGVLHGTTPKQVDTLIARRPNSRGVAKLRRILHGEVPVTLSRLERRFLRLLKEAKLPLPETNRPAGGRRVDCRWPEQRLTVELDSYTFHRSRHAWEQDRAREREAYARGDDIRRYTWGDVLERPAQMLRELRGLL
jgi:hypothetical protein